MACQTCPESDVPREAHDKSGFHECLSVVGADKRAHSGVCPEDTGGGEGRGELRSFGYEKGYFVGSYGYMVAFFERYARRCRTYYAYRIAGDKDVCIGWFAAPVDHHIVHAVCEDKESALGREHPYLDTCKFGYV